MRTRLLTLLVASTTGAGVSLAQDQPEASDIRERFAEVVRQLRDHEPVKHIRPADLAAHAEPVLGELRLYEQDPSPDVRWTVFAYYWGLGVSTDRQDIRRVITEKLLLACNDLSPLVSGYAAERLRSFEQDDFAPRARALLRPMLAGDPKDPNFWHLILVAGIAQIREEIPHLGTLLFDELVEKANLDGRVSYGRVGWAARLARARMGVEEDVARAIQVVEAESDPVVRVTKLLRDLAYIQHPAAFAAIAKYLESDERLPQVKETAPGTQYAQYAMEVLAESVPDFPVPKKGQGAYSQEDVLQARDWMTRHFPVADD